MPASPPVPSIKVKICDGLPSQEVARDVHAEVRHGFLMRPNASSFVAVVVRQQDRPRSSPKNLMQGGLDGGGGAAGGGARDSFTGLTTCSKD